MIAWLNPFALWGLLGIAGAVAVHLLARQRAPRLSFPTIRFIRAASTAAIRVRPPSDAWLLLIRSAAIAGAALALAQPSFNTAARRHSWDTRIARAIVVDTTDSMRTL